jgi:hypothetical protein
MTVRVISFKIVWVQTRNPKRTRSTRSPMERIEPSYLLPYHELPVGNQM